MVLGVLALVVAAVLAAHELIPEKYGLALIVDSSLPWLAVPILLIAFVALFRRSITAWAGILIAALVWSYFFVPQLVDHSGTGSVSMTVATENVEARRPLPTKTSNSVIDTGADIVTLQEVTSKSGDIIDRVMGEHYPYHVSSGTVGVWSKYPLSGVRQLKLGLSWSQSLSVTAAAPGGPVRIYAAHLPSVRVGRDAQRNRAVTELSRIIADDSSDRIILAGDLNTATTDRRFTELTDQLKDSRQSTGGGFGFTWPARLPVTRPDHVLVRGFGVVSDQVMDRGSSDHRGVVVKLTSD
ncbi:teicoplanin resistance protein VanJ [Spelaeicoccus albus]